MKIKLLWVVEQGMLESQMHMIEHLRNHNIDVVIECITPGDGGWESLLTNEKLDKHFAGTYDFHVMTTHVGNPNVMRFQQIVQPKIGTFDIEHDLFHDYPERTRVGKGIGTFAFTRKHHNHLTSAQKNSIRCRWYKLDGCRFDSEQWAKVSPPFHYCASADAVVIGSRLWRWPEFIWKNHFHTVWYKPFADDDIEMRGTVRLPHPFTNTQAVVELPKVARYWFTYESSCFVEALLVGCMPVLCNERIMESSPVDDVLDRVKIIVRDVGNGGELISVLAVTQKDFDRKIKLLYQPEIFERTHRILFNEYFDENELLWPTAHHALLEQIKLWWSARDASNH